MDGLSIFLHPDKEIAWIFMVHFYVLLSWASTCECFSSSPALLAPAKAENTDDVHAGKGQRRCRLLTLPQTTTANEWAAKKQTHEPTRELSLHLAGFCVPVFLVSMHTPRGTSISTTLQVQDAIKDAG